MVLRRHCRRWFELAVALVWVCGVGWAGCGLGCCLGLWPNMKPCPANLRCLSLHPTPFPQIGTWTPKGSSTRPAGSVGGPSVSYRRAWGISVQRDDDAYLWARWLAPVYSVTVANIKTALRLQVGGCG